MDELKPGNLVPKIVDMLTPFESDQRQRIITAVLAILGESIGPTTNSHKTDQKVDIEGDAGALPSKAITWMKQNDIKLEQIQQAFHIADGVCEFISSHIPGKNDKEQTHNAYILTGLGKLLSAGDTKFTDKDARALCINAGCYNATNHATYMKDKGNSLTGSKATNWSLTAPGLVQAALIVKGLAGNK